MGHDSQGYLFSGNNRDDRSIVGSGLRRRSRCQGVTHSMASSNVLNTPTADPST
jgi:hypothetical protein